MARQVLPIAGAIIGGAIGGPVGAQIGFALGSIVGNAVDPQVIQGPKLGEAGLQTSAEGVFRPVVFGTGAVKGNVIERGNRQVVTQRTQQGKGGGPVVEEQRVYWTFAIRIAEPITGVTRIWQDEKLVYDVRPSSVILDESAEYEQRFRLYFGDESQLPDPDLEAYKGVGNVNAYRGTAYIVFPNFDLTDRRESIPDFRFEVSSASSVIELEKLPELLPSPGLNSGGGVSLGQFTHITHSFVAGDEMIIAMMEAYVVQNASHPFDYANPVRVQLKYQSGTIAFDSGWMGDPAEQTALDALVISAGHPEMQGTIVDSPLVTVFNTPSGLKIKSDPPVSLEIYPEQPLGVIELWYCNPIAGNGLTYGVQMDVRQIDPDDIPVGSVANPPTPGTIIAPDGTIYSAPWGPDSIQIIGGGSLLSTIVSEMHHRLYLSSDTYDVTELTDPVLGLVLAGEYTAADAIRTLMPIYSFDGAEYDSGTGYRINYRKRGKPVVTTVTVDQLIEAQERSTREDALERPKKLHLHYENPTIGYAPAKATILRNSQDILVTGERSVQVPVSFQDVDEPAQIADRLMRQTWVEVGGEEEFVIPDNLIGLVPSDCIGVSLRGQTRRMRITSQEIGAGRIRLKMLPDRQSAYTSNITGVPVPEPTPPLPSIVGETIYSPMDIPALNDNNDRLIWYDAASGQTPAWYGAQTQHKAGAAVEFENSARFTQNTIMGFVMDDVSAASEHYTDTTNVVRVQLYTDDVLDGLTDAQFLSEGGSFALDNGDGTWEILQYRDSDDEGGNVFALSHLARGRLNTGGSEHLTGTRFVLLDAVQSVDAITAWINTDIIHRAVSFGMSPDSADLVTETYTAKSQTEFPVAHLFLERDVDTIEAMTVPRHRFGTELNPVQSVNWIGYRWTATDGTNTATIPDGTSPTISFDATGWSSPITVTVAQINRFTGPGPSVSEQIA